VSLEPSLIPPGRKHPHLAPYNCQVRTAVLIPLKAFQDAKVRLSTVLDATNRADLARQMAEIVVAAAIPIPTTVVTNDQEVANWAKHLGVGIIRDNGSGLNDAVALGVATLTAEGFEQIVVAHGDLPLANDLTKCTDFKGVSLIPDRHEDGTPVAVIPTGVGFCFSYGPGSFTRHIAEAQRLGLRWRRLDDPNLSWDVDEPEDLIYPPPL